MGLFESNIVSLPPPTRYQGSKRKLLGWIWQFIGPLEFDTVLDAFGGSACVSHFLKGRHKAVTYNDILKSNYLTGVALVENDTDKLSVDDVNYILGEQPGRRYDDFIFRTFHGTYYTDEENHWLDRVVQNIRTMDHRFKRAIAFYALFQAALVKRPYNLFHRRNLYMRFADVERGFGNKKTWDTPFEEHFRRFIQITNDAVFSSGTFCQALNLDAQDVPGQFDLVYIDPPYINRNNVGVDYYGFYHFLEGMIDYPIWHDRIDYASKHRRLKHIDSPWLRDSEILAAFRSLFQRFSDSLLVVSYRSDGIPSEGELVDAMREVKRNVKVYQLEGQYQYALSTNRKSTELLFVGSD